MGGSGFPDDPAYPTVTGTQEFKLESEGLLGYGSGDQVTSWVDDWNSHDFVDGGDAGKVAAHSVWNDESGVLMSGAQTDGLDVDRGTALGIQSGLTVFFLIKTGTISGAGANSTILQAARGPTTSRMSFVARRDAAGNYLAYWDASANWLETSTSLSDNTSYIISYRSDNSSLKVAVNGGAEEAIGNPVHQQQELYHLGMSNGGAEPFIGHIGAAIWYRTHISDADRQLVRDYLNAKYSIY